MIEASKEFILNISKQKACRIIREYYKEYEGFEGEITFRKRGEDAGEDWGGFRDYSGRIDIVFSKKTTIFGKTITERYIIGHNEVPLTKIFSTMLEDPEYDIITAIFNVIAYDQKDVDFNGVQLIIKNKGKNKVLQK